MAIARERLSLAVGRHPDQAPPGRKPAEFAGVGRQPVQLCGRLAERPVLVVAGYPQLTARAVAEPPGASRRGHRRRAGRQRYGEGQAGQGHGLSNRTGQRRGFPTIFHRERDSDQSSVAAGAACKRPPGSAPSSSPPPPLAGFSAARPLPSSRGSSPEPISRASGAPRSSSAGSPPCGACRAGPGACRRPEIAELFEFHRAVPPRLNAQVDLPGPPGET